MEIVITTQTSQNSWRNETLTFDATDHARKAAIVEGVSRAITALNQMTGATYTFTVKW